MYTAIIIITIEITSFVVTDDHHDNVKYLTLAHCRDCKTSTVFLIDLMTKELLAEGFTLVIQQAYFTEILILITNISQSILTSRTTKETLVPGTVDLCSGSTIC